MNQNNEDDDLRCFKCKNFFSNKTKPYLLPCNHNLCISCINEIKKENKKFFCPICKQTFFNIDNNKLKVNYSFLNLVIKILNNKLILCKNCNKIFYWKEHNNFCSEKFFMSDNNKIFSKIKDICHKAIKILREKNSYENLLNNTKNDIYKLINDVMIKFNKISKKIFEENINNLINVNNYNFNDDVNNINNISLFKKEIIKFLEVCKNYEKLFKNENEKNLSDFYNDLINVIEIFNNNKRNNLKDEIKKFENDFVPVVKYTSEKLNNNFILNNNNLNNNDKNNLKNNNIVIKNFVIKNNNKKSNSKNKKEKFEKFFDKIQHNRIKIFKLKKNINKNIRNNNNNKQLHIYALNNNNNNSEDYFNDDEKTDISKNINFNSKKKINNDNNNSFYKHKKNKSLIIIQDLLKDEEIIKNNKEIKNKSPNKLIISQNYIKKIIHNNKKENENKNSYSNFNDEDYEEFYQNNNNNNKKKVYEGAIMKPIEKLNKLSMRNLNNLKINKTDFNNNNNNNKKDNLNNSFNIIIEKNEINNNNNNNKNLSNLNKLLKTFNKVKDYTNKLKIYNKSLKEKLSSIPNQIISNSSTIKNKLLSDYNLLLEDIASNYIQSNIRYLLQFEENTQKISIYDTHLKTKDTKNLIDIIGNYISFNRSIGINFDDYDLLFISGGIDLNTLQPNDLFMCLRISNYKIEYKIKMPCKRAFHSSIYFKNKIYIIGGINEKNIEQRECLFFNLNTKTFENLPMLNYPRQNACICVYNNRYIYVFRGKEKNVLLETIEFLDLSNIKNGWNVFHPFDPGMCWIGCLNCCCLSIEKNKILIFGGEDFNGKLLHHSYIFKPEDKTIFRTKDLKIQAKFRNYCTVYLGKVYAFDLKNGIANKENGFHSFDIKNNCWFFEIN